MKKKRSPGETGQNTGGSPQGSVSHAGPSSKQPGSRRVLPSCDPPQHPKRRGEWAEIRFLAKASNLGLRVSRPYGDSDPYDFIVDCEGRLSRVQVKATAFRDGRWRNVYTCPVTSPMGRAYSVREVDFVAAYVIPEDVWYIIPVGEVTTTTVSLDPRSTSNKYRRYREAWDLLMDRERVEACGEVGVAGLAASDGTELRVM